MSFRAEDLLSQLNDRQREAVVETDGPVLILAGAGSGKTRAITYKIAYLIGTQRAPGDRILAVTFTNKAAEEMRERVEGLLHHPAAPVISTFHSFCVRLLRIHAERIGYRRDFAICDSDDQRAVYRRVFEELRLSEDSELTVRQVQAVISRAKNMGWSASELDRVLNRPDAELIARVFDAYQESLQRSNAMDFDDLLLRTVHLLAEHPDLRERTSDWYQYLLIDEYQDTNLPQYRLIRHLTSAHQNVSAVGDEDQSIYGFRGADIGNILRFEKDFPGAKIVKLEQNYRSTQVILDAATAVVENNIQRKGKVLWTRQESGELITLYPALDAKDEAQFVSRQLWQALQEGEGPLAVLYRTNFQSRQFEEALRHLNIPYRLVGGESFYNRKEVKDALAYLRLVVNPEDDISLLRVLNEPPRGIGKATVDRVLAAREGTQSVWKAILDCLEHRRLPGRAHLALERFRDLVLQLVEYRDQPAQLLLDQILEQSGYLEALRTQAGEEAENRILNLQELVNVAREHSERGQGLQEFLDNAALYSETDNFDSHERVTLMTLHNAKGLEFSTVFLVGCEEGLFPHSRSVAPEDLEEERRLCYVGITRARRKLFLSYSRRRRFYGRESEELNLPSRFLQEIPKHLLSVFSIYGGSQPGLWRDVSQAESATKRPRTPYPGKSYDSPDSVRQFLAQKAQSGASRQKLSVGSLVEHHSLGRGRVLHIQEQGDDLKVTVQFPGLGIKKLLQSYARLKPV